MANRTRRALLRTGAVASVAVFAGCSGGSDDDGADQSSDAQSNNTDADEDTAHDERESDDATDDTDEAETDSASLGDATFYEWLAAPIGDDPIEDYGFRYFDTAQLRAVADQFPRFEGSGTDILPAGGPVDGQLLFPIESVAQNPDTPSSEPLQVYFGDFDPQAVADGIQQSQGYDWGSPVEYGDMTLYVDEPSGSEPGVTWGFGESVSLFSRHVLESQGTQVAERVIDNSTGDGTPVWNRSEDVARLLELLAGETIVECYYGDVYGTGLQTLGVALSHTISQETVDIQGILVFESPDTLDDQLIDQFQTGFAEDGYRNLSTTTEGKFGVISGSAPTDDVDPIRSLL